MTEPAPRTQPNSTDATSCKVCGGPFSSKRLVIDGEQYHERCALVSYTSHTHENYARLTADHTSLKARNGELEAALRDSSFTIEALQKQLHSWGHEAAVNAGGQLERNSALQSKGAA